jgi:hypothetical protein
MEPYGNFWLGEIEPACPCFFCLVCITLRVFLCLNLARATNTVRLQRRERARDGEMKEYGENGAPIYPGSSGTAAGGAHGSIQRLNTRDVE